MQIIETCASIPTYFCTAIKTTTCSSWVAQTRAQQIQDGGGRRLEKSKSRYISATDWPILTKFGMMMQLERLHPFSQ